MSEHVSPEPVAEAFSSQGPLLTASQRIYSEVSSWKTHIQWAVSETLQEYDIHSARDLGQYALHSMHSTLDNARQGFQELRAQGLKGSLRSRTIRIGAAAGIAATSTIGGYVGAKSAEPSNPTTSTDILYEDSTPEKTDPTNGDKTLFMPMIMMYADQALGHFPAPIPGQPIITPAPERKADLSFTYGQNSRAGAAAIITGYPGDDIVVNFQPGGNLGPNVAKGVRVDMLVPPGLNANFKSDASEGCVSETDQPAPANQVEEISCTVDDGTLDVGEFTELPIDIGLTIDPDVDPATLPSQFRIDATIRASDPLVDPDMSNNASSATVEVQKKPEPPKPVLEVDGNAFITPDSDSFYEATEGQFAYEGSILDDDGNPIDAFEFKDKDGNTVCRFTSKGKMLVGERSYAPLDESCQTNYITSDVVPADHLVNTHGRPLNYPPTRFDGLRAAGAFTFTAASDMLLKPDAGIRIGRDTELRGELTYTLERLKVVNVDGQLELQVEEGAKSLSVNDKNPQTVTTFPLGAADRSVSMRVAEGADSADHDDLYVTIGTGDNARTEGPFAVKKVNAADQGPVIEPMLIVPADDGTPNGEATLELVRPGDRKLTPRELRDLGWQLNHLTIDPETGEPWIRVTFAPMSDFSKTNFRDGYSRFRNPGEMAAVIGHQYDGLIPEPFQPTKAAEGFNLLVPPRADALADIADVTGVAPDASLRTNLDIDQTAKVGTGCGPNPRTPRSESCFITPEGFNQPELDKSFREQVKQAVDAMHVAYTRGEKPVFRMDYLSLEDPDINPVFWSKQYAGAGAPGEAQFRGRFENLVNSAVRLRNEIAAETYPDMPVDNDNVWNTVTLPFSDSNTMINQGDFYNIPSIKAFLQRHPEIHQIDFIDNEFMVGQYGNPDPNNFNTKMFELRYTEMAKMMKEVRPGGKIGMRLVTGVGFADTEKGENGAIAYYMNFIQKLRKVYDATGVQFEIEFTFGYGDQFGLRSNMTGPYHANANEPWGFSKSDRVSRTVASGLTFSHDDDVAVQLNNATSAPRAPKNSWGPRREQQRRAFSPGRVPVKSPVYRY